MPARTLYDKVWDSHVVKTYADGTDLLYVDRHLVHEVSSPQAFAGLAARGVAVRRPDAHLAVADHAVPTTTAARTGREGLAGAQIANLEKNAQQHGLPYVSIDGGSHGIVHVIGPELGFTLPGTTLVCGDSHTCTHGALGALSFGIGTSEIECVLATQSLRQKKQSSLRIRLTGAVGDGLAAKDVALALIAKIGASGATGHAIEYAGPLIDGMSVEGRMTLCNMAVEMGARVAMVAPDDTTFGYIEGRAAAPRGKAWEQALDAWRTLRSDADATFDRDVELNASALVPHVTWGTTPEQAAPVTGAVPDPDTVTDTARRDRMRRSLSYMGLKPGTRIEDIAVDRVFIGSCTNSRISDLRDAARVLVGRKLARSVRGIVVPGSARVRAQAEAEGLDRIFIDAGMEWRQPGCSMCVAMNDDRLEKGQRAASTSNRNFEGRQGLGSRTHLLSPAMAAAAAVAGRFVDVRALLA